MAEPQILKTGDTWPPLTLTLTESAKEGSSGSYTDEDGNTVRRVDLFTAPPDSIRFVMKLAPSTIVDGAMLNAEVEDGSGTTGSVAGEDPGLGVPANRGQARYMWAAGDRDNPGAYGGEVEVTWDDGSTPPAIETYPNDSDKNFAITLKSDLD